jgi:hypothetical protein
LNILSSNNLAFSFIDNKVDQRYTKYMNITKEKVKTNTRADKIAMQLLYKDFRNIKDQLYEVCKFYSEPQNNPGYFKWQEGKDLVYRDYMSKKVIEMEEVINFDCFQFVWFVLQELAETGVIGPKIESYQPVYNTILKLHVAIEKGYMIKLEEINQLSVGIIFFLKTPEGWENMGERHLGFYFTNGDKVQMISDRNSAKGVDIETFGKQEFFDKFSGMSGCFVSSNS